MIVPDIFKTKEQSSTLNCFKPWIRQSQQGGRTEEQYFVIFMQKTSYELKLGQSILHLLQGSDTLQGFSLAGQAYIQELYKLEENIQEDLKKKKTENLQNIQYTPLAFLEYDLELIRLTDREYNPFLHHLLPPDRGKMLSGKADPLPGRVI